METILTFWYSILKLVHYKAHFEEILTHDYDRAWYESLAKGKPTTRFVVLVKLLTDYPMLVKVRNGKKN